jgi:hypothetical protein
LKKRRLERERADVQREIDRLQEEGGERCDQEIVALWARKQELVRRIEEIGSAAGTAFRSGALSQAESVREHRRS